MRHREIGLTLLAMVIASVVAAKINPRYAPAMERGYTVEGDSVVLPDGSRCQLDEFNHGICGKEWYDVEYCVGEGKPVWNPEKCCEGLKATLGDDEDGQPTCQKKPSKKASTKESDKNWFERLLGNSFFWIGLLLPFLFLAYLSIAIKRRLRKRQETERNQDG